LRRGSTATSREYAQVEARVLLQEHLEADRQLLFVLSQVLAIDPVQQFVVGVGIRVVHARLVTRRRRGQAACPGGDGARGIGGSLATQRGQVLPQACSLTGVDLGLSLKGQGSQQKKGNRSQHNALLAAPWQRRRQYPHAWQACLSLLCLAVRGPSWPAVGLSRSDRASSWF